MRSSQAGLRGVTRPSLLLMGNKSPNGSRDNVVLCGRKEPGQPWLTHSANFLSSKLFESYSTGFGIMKIEVGTIMCEEAPMC